MPRSRSLRRESTRSSTRTGLTEEPENSSVRTKREASVYDAVAGRVGLNGFLGREQLASPHPMPSSPEEVLLRRVGAPDQIPYGFYDADQMLDANHKLPDSDLLKALHSYVSDFYAYTTADRGQKDSRSFDGTALLALGILLEEASREALGETGDMALVEPEGLEDALPESKLTQYQVIGRVKPQQIHQKQRASDESSSDREQSARKRRRVES